VGADGAVVVKVVSSQSEAEVVCGLLRSAGIECAHRDTDAIDSPLEDFIAKFIGVKYVVDPGTSKEKTYVFGNDDDLGIFNDGITVAANSVSLGTLKPLSVGDHVVDSYLLFSAMHCDGIDSVVEENCLPAGETWYSSVQFTVTPGHD